MTKRAQPPTVEELIAQARAGDEQAREKLFNWCMPAMLDWATRLLAKKHPGIARPSDITQDAAIVALRAFPSFRGHTQSEWMAWLETIVHTRAVQSFRDAGRMKRDPRKEVPLDQPDVTAMPAQQPTASQAIAKEEQWRQVLRHIIELPEDQRQAIWLCHLKKLRVAEVAERMGKSQGAVAGLLQRGLQTLREQMAIESEPLSGVATPSMRDEVTAALLAYLRRRDAGDVVTMNAFVAEHPSCADELRQLLIWVDRVQALEPKTLDDSE